MSPLKLLAESCDTISCGLTMLCFSSTDAHQRHQKEVEMMGKRAQEKLEQEFQVQKVSLHWNSSFGLTRCCKKCLLPSGADQQPAEASGGGEEEE